MKTHTTRLTQPEVVASVGTRKSGTGAGPEKMFNETMMLMLKHNNERMRIGINTATVNIIT